MITALVGLAALVLVGCASASSGDASPSAAPLTDAAAALCTAKRHAARDPLAARRVFYDRAHDHLHELARQAQRTDRPVAARLLEAKQRVGHDLDAGAAPQRLAGDLDRLLAATDAALTVISSPSPTCIG
jgi:cytosine/adenosine deaminase-related metal-dependent hydrolase